MNRIMFGSWKRWEKLVRRLDSVTYQLAPLAIMAHKLRVMVMKQLRQETSQRHAALELKLPLLAPNLAKETYRRRLISFWGYYQPLEEQLLALNWPPEMNLDYSVLVPTANV